MTVDMNDPKMVGYAPLQEFIDQDQDQSSRRIRDMPFGKRKEELQFSVESLNFGTWQTGHESPTQIVVISNVGWDEVNIYGHDLLGEFELKTVLPNKILAGQTISIQIAFKPISVGSKIGSIYINSGNAAGDELIELSGSGVPYDPETNIIDGGFYGDSVP